MSRAVDHVLYAALRALGGSFSAEHGVGAKRIPALVATSDPAKLATMMLHQAGAGPRPDPESRQSSADPQPLAREKSQ
jgi:hypothetical protein